MAGRRIRGKEGEIQVIVGSTRMSGSLRKITNFNYEPQAEISKTRFIGERRENMDLDIGSHDFSFTTHVNDFSWWTDLWQQIQDAERLGEEFPEITVVVSLKLRGGNVQNIVLSDDLIMKLDSLTLPGDEYTTLDWSGSCQQAQGA